MTKEQFESHPSAICPVRIALSESWDLKFYLQSFHLRRRGDLLPHFLIVLVVAAVDDLVVVEVDLDAKLEVGSLTVHPVTKPLPHEVERAGEDAVDLNKVVKNVIKGLKNSP